MNHNRAIACLPAYADGQLGPVRAWFLRRHINRCATCLAALDGLQSLRTAVRTNLATHRAPPNLASRISLALPRETPPPVRLRSRPAIGFGLSGLAGACAGVALTLALLPRPDPLVGDVVDDHIRSLLADHLTDVASTDQHTVKPWLAARLDLSPVVKDLAAEGYPLIGGRLDYVQHRRAAALVYQRAKHVINLFVFTADGPPSQVPALSDRDGFNVVRWRQGGLAYVAVSDVEASQLLTFAQLVAGS